MNIYILQIIAFINTHIYAIITIIINNNHKYMSYFTYIVFKILFIRIQTAYQIIISFYIYLHIYKS